VEPELPTVANNMFVNIYCLLIIQNQNNEFFFLRLVILDRKKSLLYLIKSDVKQLIRM